MKNHLSRILVACLLGATAGMASAVPVNLIENGSFEDNIVGSGSWVILKNGVFSGWNVKGQGVEIRNNVAGSAYDGNNFVELDTDKHSNNSSENTNSWIAQTFETVANQTYLLSFFYSPRMGVGAASNIIEVLISGLADTVLSVTGDGFGASGNIWKEYTYSFVATDDSTTLKFRAAGTSDTYGGSLDNVSVFALGGNAAGEPAAIPEPATWSIMLAGLAGVWTVSRRRTR